MNDDRMLRSVVLPEPVPPETRMLKRARTQERRNDMRSGLDDRNRFTTSAGPHFSLANFRIVRQGPLRAMGGMTTLTREPSFRRASQMGVDSSTRLPTRLTMRSMTCLILRSLSKVTADSVASPAFSTYISFGRFPMLPRLAAP